MDIDDFLDIYVKNKQTIDKHLKKYYMYVKSEPNAYDELKTIVRHGRQCVQRGGYDASLLAGIGISTIGLSLSSLLMTIIVGVGLHIAFNKQKCSVFYPLVSHDKPISFSDLVYIFFPKELIYDDANEKHEIANIELNEVIKNVTEMSGSVDAGVINIIYWLDNLDMIISKIDPESTVGQVSMRTLQTILGSLATVAGVGIPLDTVVNLIFTIKDAIAFAIKLLNLLSYILKLLNKMCPSERNELTYYIYDILNINFKTGPIGVKCQYDYIKKQYVSHEKFNFMLCKMLSVIYSKFASFMSNAIASSIPYNFGVLSHTLYATLQSGTAKGAVLNMIINKTVKTYNKIPSNMKLILQLPNGIGDFIKCSFDPYMFKLIYDNLDDAIKKSVKSVSSFVPFGFNPVGFAINATFGMTQKMTNIASKAIIGSTPKDIIMSGILSLFGLSLAEVLSSPIPPYCSHLTTQKKKRTKQVIQSDTSETQPTERNKLSKTIIKYGSLLGFLIHKLLALSFLLLYVFKSCPIGTKLDEIYNEIMNKDCIEAEKTANDIGTQK